MHCNITVHPSLHKAIALTIFPLNFVYKVIRLIQLHENNL